MRQLLLRQLSKCLTVITSNSDCLNSDCQLTPPQDEHMRRSPQHLTAIVDRSPPTFRIFNIYKDAALLHPASF